MINWKIRIGDKSFWMALIPSVLVLIEAVAAMLGFTVQMEGVGEKLLEAVRALFVVLGIIGIVRDPTTPGLEDSQRALQYVQPGVLPDTSEE